MENKICKIVYFDEDSVTDYVENPDKTENPAFYGKQEMTDRQTQGLSDVIDYAVNSEKTQATDEATEVMQQFISGVNCHPATAREEMIAVKKRFGKEDGIVAYHGYQRSILNSVKPVQNSQKRE